MAEEQPGQVASSADSDHQPAQAGGLRGFALRHPQLVAWAVLSVVMVALVLWSAKDVQLLPTQLLSIVIATVVLAGLCVWIIGWD